MIKSVLAPHLGRTVKFGRKRPMPGAPKFRLRRYLRVPTVPSSADYSAKAASVLSNIYLNDQLGCCVVSGGYHVVGTETGNADNLFTATDDQIIKDYGSIGGYVPGDPNTDQGCDEQTALNFWTSNGFANGTKLLGWMAVDGTNPQELMAACYLFENLFFGMELPDAWISPFPSSNGFTWGVAGDPDPQNGHCVVGVGYDTNGIKIDTWGLLGTLTYDAIAKYCTAASGGEVYVMLTPDQLAKGQQKVPNGVDWADLISDFIDMGGSIISPPAPAPTPGGQSPTLDQVMQWASQGAAQGVKANWPTTGK
jgi:hypothetical protein